MEIITLSRGLMPPPNSSFASPFLSMLSKHTVLHEGVGARLQILLGAVLLNVVHGIVRLGAFFNRLQGKSNYQANKHTTPIVISQQILEQNVCRLTE